MFRLTAVLRRKITAETAKGNFTDGTFTGEGQGNNGPIKVEVTVKDGSITEIQVPGTSRKPQTSMPERKNSSFRN